MEPRPHRPSLRLDGIRILIVDDAPESRNALEILVGSFGATAIVAGDGWEAVRLASEQQPNLISSICGCPAWMDSPSCAG